MKTYRKRVLVAVSVVGLLCVLYVAASASATSANPRWHVSMRSYPTNLAEGSGPSAGVPVAREALPEYSIYVRNVGAGGATGPVTVTVTLPQGITSDPSLSPEIGQLLPGNNGTNAYEPCETPSAETVICTAAAAALPSGTEVPGAAVRVGIALDVGSSIALPALAEVKVSGGGVPTEAMSAAITISSSEATFGFLHGSDGLTGAATTAAGLDASLAGSHPYSVLLEGAFTSREVALPPPSIPLPWPTQAPEEISFELPRGLAVNPQAPRKLCTEGELISAASGEGTDVGCPPASQVGYVAVTTLLSGASSIPLPLYDMNPPPGAAAELGFNVLGTIVHIQGGLDGKFHLVAGSSSILAKYPVLAIQAALWGDPGDPVHDIERRGRSEGREGGCGLGGCALLSGEANTVPFITMPTSCGEALSLGATAHAWEGGNATTDSNFIDEAGSPLEMEGCNALAFEPTIESKATTNVGENPTGLNFAIHQPQNESLEGRATAALKDAQVALPEGVTLNASAANGLGSCTETQMGYAPAEGKVQFSTNPQTCPNSAKVGTLKAKTPLLGHELPGSIYVATPFENPFGSLLAIYLAVEDEESGIVAKLAGEVMTNPITGQLSATFKENPELPLEDVDLEFFDGPGAALTTPMTCGPHTSTSTLTPWSTPEGADAHPSSSFKIEASCSASEAQAPKAVTMTAGTVSPLSGAYSPFVLHLSRPDGSQHITGIETTLPAGLLGKLAGVSYCPETAIAQAISREHPEMGKVEQRSPSCPSSSEVGTVQVTAGSGSNPIPVSGHAYLAGPYKGASLSLAVIVPAVAGPFDLGTVVDRVALNVGEYDARIHAVADPLPTIREGIPLDVRSIELKLDRPSFTLNPTSCDAMAIEGRATTQAGQSATLTNRFQVGECGRLGFKPSLKISLKGGTKRAAHPALKAMVTYPSKGVYANIARAQVSLPHSEFLDPTNIGLACTKPVLAARACPAKSIYGKAKAWTPLLDKPLEGPVFLVGGYGYKLPALVAELKGQIRVLLVGKVDTDKQGGIRNTFEAVPDAPVSRFVLEMKGGKKYGLLQNSENICSKTQKAGALFNAQNGKLFKLSPTIANSCGSGHKKKSGKKPKH